MDAGFAHSCTCFIHVHAAYVLLGDGQPTAASLGFEPRLHQGARAILSVLWLADPAGKIDTFNRSNLYPICHFFKQSFRC